MALSGFDGASSAINKRVLARREKQKIAVAKYNTEKKAEKEKKEAVRAQFDKVATPYEKWRNPRLGGDKYRESVIAKHKPKSNFKGYDKPTPLATAQKQKEKNVFQEPGNITKFSSATSKSEQTKPKQAKPVGNKKPSKVTGAVGSELRRKQYDALNWKYDDTIKKQSTAKAVSKSISMAKAEVIQPKAEGLINLNSPARKTVQEVAKPVEAKTKSKSRFGRRAPKGSFKATMRRY